MCILFLVYIIKGEVDVIVDRNKVIDTRNHCMDLDNNKIAVQSLDVNGSIIDVSPGWLQLTGHQREEVIGKHFLAFLADGSELQVQRNFPQLKDYGYVNNVPLKLKCKDDKILSVHLTGTSKYADDGEFERTFCELTMDKNNAW